MPAPPSRRTRRATLAIAGLGAGLGAAAGLGGCSWDSLKPPRPTAASPRADTDETLVREVATRLAAASPGSPAPFRALNRAHLRALRAPRPAASAARRTPWQGRQRQLATDIAAAAVRAQDGELARLFASMAAGQLQLLHARGLA